MEIMPSSTINEFCAEEQICRATYYNLQKQGKGPRVYYVGTRPRISEEAKAEWRAARQAEAEAAASARAATAKQAAQPAA